MTFLDLLKNKFFISNGKLKKGKFKQSSNVGSLYSNRYYSICINKVKYPYSFILYCIYHNKVPKYVRHIDGNLLNNNIENLEESDTDELQNIKHIRRKIDGLGNDTKYIVFSRNRYNVVYSQTIDNKKERHYIGSFDNLEEAIKVRDEQIPRIKRIKRRITKRVDSEY